MPRYKVTFEVIIGEDHSHPRKWVPESIAAQLSDGEEAYNWDFEELPDVEPNEN